MGRLQSEYQPSVLTAVQNAHKDLGVKFFTIGLSLTII
jgi:hypothetical protein